MTKQPMSDNEIPAAGRTTTVEDNRPPADPFLANLEENHAAIVAQRTDLEMESMSLPREVQSDEDEAKITAWVVKARKLARAFEDEREVAGRPILVMQKKVNGFFGALRDGLKGRATEIEARNAPYLRAKREKQEALAREAAARKREEERLAAERATALRRQQEEAQKAQEDAARKVREAAAAADDAAAAKAAEEMRQAGLAITASATAAQEAEKEAETAGRQADKHTTVAEGGHALNRRDPGATGNVRVETVWEAEIFDRAALYLSIGPLCPHFPQADVDRALIRAASAKVRPEIPGVRYLPRDKVKTTALRA